MIVFTNHVNHGPLKKDFAMSHDPNKDWKKFREITAMYCEHELKFLPAAAEEKWMISCYQSLAAFVKRFPSSESREEIIRKLQETTQAVGNDLDRLLKIYRQIFGDLQ